VQCKKHGHERINQHKGGTGLSVVSDCATVNHAALINIIAMAMSMLLAFTDCAGCMVRIFGAELYHLAILDGASNMQLVGRMITAKHPQITGGL
jgi:hypothetical protein